MPKNRSETKIPVSSLPPPELLCCWRYCTSARCRESSFLRLQGRLPWPMEGYNRILTVAESLRVILRSVENTWAWSTYRLSTCLSRSDLVGPVRRSTRLSSSRTSFWSRKTHGVGETPGWLEDLGWCNKMVETETPPKKTPQCLKNNIKVRNKQRVYVVVEPLEFNFCFLDVYSKLVRTNKTEDLCARLPPPVKCTNMNHVIWGPHPTYLHLRCHSEGWAGLLWFGYVWIYISGLMI